MKSVSIVMPVYNEVDTIKEILGKLVLIDFKELIIVDDYSTDGTRKVLEKIKTWPGVEVVYHPANLGKGSALRTGFWHATGDIVVIQDADLEYNPAEIRRLIMPIMTDEADVVYGSRFLGTNKISIMSRIANGALSYLTSKLTGLKITDMETGYKAFSREILNYITIEENRFGVEPEITIKMSRLPGRFMEVPVSYNPRSIAQGKKIRFFKDGLQAVRCIYKYGGRNGNPSTVSKRV